MNKNFNDDFFSEIAEKFPKTFPEFNDWYNSFTRTHASNIKLKMPKMLGKDDVYTWPLFVDLPYEFQYAVLLAYFAYKGRMIFPDKAVSGIFFMKLFDYAENDITDTDRTGYASDGAMMIYRERIEQIQKHGYTIDHDKANNNQELIAAALSVLMKDISYYPSWWDSTHFKKIVNKPEEERLAIAGAFIAAQIDLNKEENKLNDGIYNRD